jgi:hypothetical protein
VPIARSHTHLQAIDLVHGHYLVTPRSHTHLQAIDLVYGQNMVIDQIIEGPEERMTGNKGLTTQEPMGLECKLAAKAQAHPQIYN